MATTASPALGPRYLASATGMGRDRAALPAPVPLPAEITALPWQDAAQLHLAIQQLLKCPCPFWRLQHPPSTQVRAGAATVPSPWGSPAAPPLLSGWISLKGVLAAANPFMQWEKNT